MESVKIIYALEISIYKIEWICVCGNKVKIEMRERRMIVIE